MEKLKNEKKGKIENGERRNENITKWKLNKMKIENWKYDCVAHAMNMTLQSQ